MIKTESQVRHGNTTYGQSLIATTPNKNNDISFCLQTQVNVPKRK